ncbi:MAG: hypothetical protein A2583_02605 [Bdellovibrionales bacterium RIFOXYD1_FULL_53_11]|nr:MAG: hypothetical protein A2583_02605 [Bdellovibrionales bacterium RIFOXYD1_FULL_53_11]
MQLLVVLTIAILSSFAQAPAQDWQDVRSRFDAGKFAEALVALNSLPDRTALYYYNAGTIHFRMGQFGAALAHLEKADRLRPRDTGIRHNLRLAREALARQLGAERIDPASTWLEATAGSAPLDEIRGVLGLVALVLSFFWIITYLKNRSLRRTLLGPTGIIGITALLITFAIYVAQRSSDAFPPAACIEPLQIRSGPGDQFAEMARAEPGQKFRLLGHSARTGSDEWRQIRYSKDGIGWIRSSGLLPL